MKQSSDSRNFLANIGLCTLYQFDRKTNLFYAWLFDGLNQIGEKVSGATKEKAISNLRDSVQIV